MTILAWYLLSSRSIEALDPTERDDLVRQAAEWIRSERDSRRQLAEPLAPSEIELFGPYFPTELLRRVRVQAVDAMPSPGFLGKIRHQGEQIFDFRQARGLALDDVLLLRGADVPPGSPSRRSVLFHELVHAVQYDTLGVDTFVEQYLASLIAVDYRYPDIVFEDQAFELQHRFAVEPQSPFSVVQEVRDLTRHFPGSR